MLNIEDDETKMLVSEYLTAEAQKMAGSNPEKQEKALQYQPICGFKYICPACFVEKDKYVKLTSYDNTRNERYYCLRCSGDKGGHRFQILVSLLS